MSRGAVRGSIALVMLILLSPAVPAQVTVPGTDDAEEAPAPVYDLAVSSAWVDPEEPDHAHPFRLCAVVQNSGDPDPPPFSVSLLLDGTPFHAERFHSFPSSRETVCANATASLGGHAFEAVADADDEVEERSDENNGRRVSFFVGEPKVPDLLVSARINPDPPRWGEMVHFVADVENLGNGESGKYFLNFSFNGRRLSSSLLPSILPGGSSTFQANFHVNQMDPGPGVLVVAAFPSDAVFADANETDNVATRNVTIPRRPGIDLAAVNLSWTDPPRESFPANVTAVVANEGEMDAGAFVVRFVLDNRTTIASPRLGGLAAGASTNVTIDWRPRGVGEHFLSVIVDPSNAVPEHSEENNALHASVAVLPESDEPLAPDLVLARVLHLPSEPRPGDVVNLTAVVRNDGPVRSAPFEVLFEVDGVFAGSARYPGLAAGASIASLATWSGLGGEHMVKVTVDPTNEVGEPDESNNVNFATLRVRDAPPPEPEAPEESPPPDEAPEPSDVDAPGSGAVGESRLEVAGVTFLDLKDGLNLPDPRLSARIFNDGDAVAPPFAVHFHLDGELVGTVNAAGLAPKKEVSVSWGKNRDRNFTSPEPGEHTLRVVAVKQGESRPAAGASMEVAFTVNDPKAVPGASTAALVAALGAVAAASRLRPSADRRR